METKHSSKLLRLPQCPLHLSNLVVFPVPLRLTLNNHLHRRALLLRPALRCFLIGGRLSQKLLPHLLLLPFLHQLHPHLNPRLALPLVDTAARRLVAPLLHGHAAYCR